MKFDFSDNFLLLATGITLYISYRAILETLNATKLATRTVDNPPPPPEQRSLPPNAEDQIDLKTLRTLSRSHNHDIRSASIRIYLARVLNTEGTLKALLRDLRSLSYEKRNNGINGLWLLIYGLDLNDTEANGARRGKLQTKEVYTSLVRALINVLPEHSRLAEDDNGKGKEKEKQGRWDMELPPSPIRPLKRSPHELSLMVMLTKMYEFWNNLDNERKQEIEPVQVLLDAGIVSQWLANYPFPCTLEKFKDGNFKKSDVVDLFEPGAYYSDDTLMGTVIFILSRTKNVKALKELREAGLRTGTFKEDLRSVRRRSWEREDGDVDTDILMVGGEDTAGLGRWREVESSVRARPRSIERSDEEARLRRSHREAIVLADTGEPVGRENIIQRQDSGLMSQVAAANQPEQDEHGQGPSALFSSLNTVPSVEEGTEVRDHQDREESPQSFRRRSQRLRDDLRGIDHPG